MNRFPDTVSFLYPVQLEPCVSDESGETTLPVFSLTAPDSEALCQMLVPLVSEIFHCGTSHALTGYECDVWLFPLLSLTALLQQQTTEQSENSALTDPLRKACRRWSRHAVTHIRLTAAVRYQHFGIEQQIWGHENAGYDPALRKQAARLTGDACEYCGYVSAGNPLTFRDSNPDNTTSSNLTVACSVCLCSRHLNRLGANDGVMVYLPELAPADISRLIRAIITARKDGDERQKNGASMLLNWLAAHRSETEHFWGTSHPGEFGQALQKSSPALRESLQQRLRHIALIPNPDLIANHPYTANLPASSWAALYKQHCSRS